MRMRILALGNQIMIRMLTASLAGDGIEVVGLSEIREAETLLEQERFDLAIVDSLIREAGMFCRCISKLERVPVVLMIREMQADWTKLQSVDADGFIPDWVGQTELTTRLKAIVRRWS